MARIVIAGQGIRPAPTTSWRCEARTTSCSPIGARSRRVPQARQWEASGSSSHSKRRCAWRARRSASSRSSGSPLLRAGRLPVLRDDGGGPRDARAPRRAPARPRGAGRACRCVEDRGPERGRRVGAVACWEDGVAEPAKVARELVRRAAEGGVEVREGVDARDLERDVLVIAAGASSPELWPDLPIRPLCRQLVDVGPVAGLPDDLPMILEAETGFHFRRRGDTLRLAMNEPTPRWTAEEAVDETLVEDWRGRLAERYPPPAGAPVVRSWAGLYDMTPDAHPIIGWVARASMPRAASRATGSCSRPP